MDFVFDDEPLESILYDKPSPGPTPASIYAATREVVSSVVEALENSTDMKGAAQRFEEMLARDAPVSTDDLRRITAAVAKCVPGFPCPLIDPPDVPCGPLLERILAVALARTTDSLVEPAGWALYRYYEGVKRYTDGARVIRVLLAQAERSGDVAHQAVLSNNLGYEYFLDRHWEQAEPYLARAVELFDATGPDFERVNAQLNLLVCRFEASQLQPDEQFEAKLCELRDALAPDWRRRKALILLARLAEGRGDISQAIQFARQAVRAARGVPTRLRRDDAAYLGRLRKAAQPVATGQRTAESPEDHPLSAG